MGIGQPDSVAKYGIGESIGRAGEVLEDDYGIAVEADRFVDIVTGVDPSKFSKGSGRIGDDVRRRGLGFGADGRSIHTTSQVPVPDLIPYSKHAKTTTASSSIQSLILLNLLIAVE